MFHGCICVGSPRVLLCMHSKLVGACKLNAPITNCFDYTNERSCH